MVERTLQRNVQFHRHQLGDLVGLLIGVAQHPAHITDDAAGSHGAKGDNLRHVVMAVLARHIVNHLTPALIAQVDVQIGHGHALGVQKPLKQQVVFQGIQLGDIQTVGDNRASAAAAARAHHDVLLPRKADKIPHNQEIIHKAHAENDIQLIFQALDGCLGIVGIPRMQPLKTQPPQQFFVAFTGVFIGDVQGQVVGGKIKIHLAAHGDLMRAGDGFAQMGEKRAHLFLAFDVKLLRLHAHALLILQGLARLDAHQHLLRWCVLFF